MVLMQTVFSTPPMQVEFVVVQVKPYLLEGTEKSQKYAHMTYHQ
jgi:hypothetical protein